MVQGRVFVAQRKQGGPAGLKWEFPGGKLESGETPQQCLGRELWEELHIAVSVGAYFGSSIHAYDGVTVKLLAYWVQWNGQGSIDLRSHLVYEWVGKEELLQLDFAAADLPLVAKLRNQWPTSV